MKIVHVTSSLNVGGAERFVLDLCEEQINRGCTASILSMGEADKSLKKDAETLNVQLFFSTNIRELRAVFAGYDTVHVHSAHCLLRVLLATLLLPIKVVYTHHNESVDTSIKWQLTSLLAWLKVKKIVFVSAQAELKYLKQYPSFKGKACTVLNGVKSITRAKSEHPKFRIGHVGRFVPLKAQHFLIEAVAKLPEPIQRKVKLCFYGTGELESKNKTLAERVVEYADVEFCGLVTNREQIYSNTDLLVVTSETEGLSLAILEAMASATPVIASSVGGNIELIKHKDNGFLYPFGDTEKLAQYIEEIIKDKETYSLFSERNFRLYNASYSMKNCEQQYFDIYQQAMDE